MTDEIGLTETRPEAALHELDSLFSDLDRKGAYARAAGSNFIIVSSCGGAGSLKDYIDLLSVLRPGRLFVVSPQSGLSGLHTRVAALCRPVSRSEHVCCELIEITFGPETWPALPSVLFSLMRSGYETELFVRDGAAMESSLQHLAALAQRLIFDSGEFRSGFVTTGSSLADMLKEKGRQLVDLKWLSFALWREQLRFVFDKPAAQSVLPFLSRIEVIMHGKEKSGIPSVGLLAAGWLMDRMGLELVGKGKEGVFLRNSYGGNVTLNLASSCALCAEALDELKLEFNDRRRSYCVSLFQGSSLQTVVRLDEEFKLSVPFESVETIDLLKKFYVVGDSTLNYPASLRAAFKLQSLLIS